MRSQLVFTAPLTPLCYIIDSDKHMPHVYGEKMGETKATQ